MELSVWTYEGPPHIGAMRIANSMRNVHFIMHAPQGDTYADLLFTMIERNNKRPPVSYTTFQARDLGADTADLFRQAVLDTYERFCPDAMLVGSSCTAELIQDDPAGLATTLGLPIPIVAVDLPAYQKKENWGAAETFYRLVRTFAKREITPRGSETPLCNILGPSSLGFRNRDDLNEIKILLDSLGIEINIIAPMGAGIEDLRRIGYADFNVVLYPEIAGSSAAWLKKNFSQPSTTANPTGMKGISEFIGELRGITNRSLAETINSRLPWYSQSVDSTYLTGKRVYVFGDATHAIAAARVARDELGFEVVGLGTYSLEFAREVRQAATKYNVVPLISDDYLQVEAAIEACQPELVLGTQMERNIAKRLGIACAVISAPTHVQDFPARYSPQMGAEGANVIFDSWVHPLMMGLEEHLLAMFRQDFEFNEQRAPSHLAQSKNPPQQEKRTVPSVNSKNNVADSIPLCWSKDAITELQKIPFFVRGKAKKNTEKFAALNGTPEITLETLYEAKAFFARS